MDSLPIKHPASYRDPAGFIFHHEGKLYRQVNQCFREDFDLFISSGLYKELSTSGMLVEHQVLGTNFTADEECYKTITPEVVKFISYPYEWCFQMLKDAALLTLALARKAIDHGLILKDASPYNIQLHNGKLIFIDSLSFARYDETKPWIAYRQFCENFLAPLAIMHYSGMPLHSLSLAYPEGIPLVIAQKLLPFQSKFSLHQYLHLHLHNKLSKKSAEGNKSKSFSLHKLKNILRSLETAVSHLQLNYKGIWSEYYPEAAQRQNYLPEKKEIIARWIERIEASTVFDAGANDGTFSRLTNARGWFTLSADIDHSAVTKLYGEVIKESLSIHPLIIDLANPSPANGVNYEERKSLPDRFHADLILALALIHHLAIGKNIPFEMIAKMFRQLGEKLIIEFVPKDDEKIQLMLQQKQDIYHWYTEFNFKQAFSKYYTILEVKELFRGPNAIFNAAFMKLRGNDFFIFLLPVYFVFHNYTTNFPSVSIPIALTVLFRYLFIAVLLYIVFYFVFKQRLKAAVFTFSVLAVQLFFGPFHDGLKSLFGGLFITRYSFFDTSVIAGIDRYIFLLKKSQKKFNRIASYLSVVLLVFILIDVFMLMSKAGSTKDLEIEDKSWQAIKCDTCTKNDIYLIIADEYAGNTELKELMKFDNSNFESALQKRGFYVVPNSISNYNYTPFSVASILSMEYLQGITKQSNKISNRSISYEKINNNTLIKTLSDHGYSFFNLSLFDFAGRPTQADNMFFLTREKLITGQTFTQRVNTDIGFNLITRLGLKTEMKNLSEKIWETNVWILNQTKKIASNKSGEPKFVYTHLNMPHYPYFFDRNGKPYPVETLMEGYQHRIEPYTEYLQYCNTIFIDLIDHIIKTSKQPPIIIFMGDHGFRHFEKPVAEKYHFMNMNAIYFPDKNYASFYEGMSAVNLFRIVMNTQFNQKLPLLKDSTSFMVEY